MIDTLRLAKELHPGQKNNLDALCRRYAVDNSNRTLHGALLDAELLADVYIAMTRGQDSLLIEMREAPEASVDAAGSAAPKLALRVVRASEEELLAHAALLSEIEKESKGACIWIK